MFTNSRRTRGFAFFVILAMTASLVATGQEATSRDKLSATKGLRWGDPGAAVVGFNIIKVPTVQKELNLTARQKQQVVKAYDQQQIRFAKVVQARDQAQRDGQPVTGPIPLDTRPTEKAIMEFLSPEQRRRFQQLQFRHSGPQVFRREEVAKILNLSDEQRAFIQSVFDEMTSAQDELYKAREQTISRIDAEQGPVEMEHFQAVQRKAPKAQLDQIRKRLDSSREAILDYDEKNRRMSRALEQKALKAIFGVMTRRQRENLDKMLGKPFDFDTMPLVDESPESEKKAATASVKSQ